MEFDRIIEYDDKKPILLIGTFRNDAIINEIYMAKKSVISKNLTSKPSNWDNILKLLERKSPLYSCVILNLTESILLIACNITYRPIFFKLLNCIKKFPHIILMYEDTLKKKYNIFDKPYYKKYLYYEYFFENRNLFNELLQTHENDQAKLLETLKNEYVENIGAIPENFIYSKYNNPEIKDSDMRSEQLLSAQEWNDIMNKINKITEAKIEKHLILPENPSIIDSMTDEEYREFRKEIAEIERKTQQAFENAEYLVFNRYLKENMLLKNNEIQTAIDEINDIIKEIELLNMNVSPFKFNLDIVNILREFFRNNENKTIFKKYIYKDQMLSEELERFLLLFQDYITKIKKIDISFEETKTDIGTIYVIKSNDKKMLKSGLKTYIDEFSDFIDICDSNIELARSTLINYDLTKLEIENILIKYKKEAKRLKMDIRQEYERKLLEIKHATENQASEYELSKLVDSNIFSIDNRQNSAISTIMNIDKLYIDVANNGIMARTVLGNIEHNEYDSQLVDLIKNLSDSNENLYTELQILKDKKSEPALKNEASVKLRSFLAKHAQEIGKIGYSLLQKYLEGLLL